MRDEHNHQMQSWLHMETWKMHSKRFSDLSLLARLLCGSAKLRKAKKDFRFRFEREEIFVVDLGEDSLKI